MSNVIATLEHPLESVARFELLLILAAVAAPAVAHLAPDNAIIVPVAR